MKVVSLTDIHGDLKFISYLKSDIQDADLVLLTGDITHFGRKPEIKKIIEIIKEDNERIFAIPGNCDYPEVNQYLVDEGISLDCRFCIQDGFFMMGVGGSLPCPGTTPNEYSEDEFATMLEETVKFNPEGLPLILLTHQPPFNTVNDQLNDGFHVGSNSIRQFIEKYQPVLCLSGHVHEGVGKDWIGKSVIVNPGSFKMGGYTRSLIFKDEVNVEIMNVFLP